MFEGLREKVERKEEDCIEKVEYYKGVIYEKNRCIKGLQERVESLEFQLKNVNINDKGSQGKGKGKNMKKSMKGMGMGKE